MAATKKQLAALKKARAARKKNLSKPARKSNPISKYIIKIVDKRCRVGYVSGYGVKGASFDTEIKKAKDLSKSNADMIKVGLMTNPLIKAVSIIKKK